MLTPAENASARLLGENGQHDRDRSLDVGSQGETVHCLRGACLLS